MTDYSQGGYIPGSPAPMPVTLHPDECLLTVDKATKRATCRRVDHPTPTSDCTRLSWISPPEDAES